MVIKNKNVKIMLNFSIQTDKIITARRPEVSVIEKEKKAKE